MEERPKIKLELTTTDIAFEIIGWLSVLAIWGLTILRLGINCVFKNT